MAGQWQDAPTLVGRVQICSTFPFQRKTQHPRNPRERESGASEGAGKRDERKEGRGKERKEGREAAGAGGLGKGDG